MITPNSLAGPPLYAVTPVYTPVDLGSPLHTRTTPDVILAVQWYLDADHPGSTQATLYRSAPDATWSPAEPRQLLQDAYHALDRPADPTVPSAEWGQSLDLVRRLLVHSQAMWLDARLRPEVEGYATVADMPYASSWDSAGAAWAVVWGPARPDVLRYLVSRYPAPQDEGVERFGQAVQDTLRILAPLQDNDLDSTDLSTALAAGKALYTAAHNVEGRAAARLLDAASARYLDRALDLDPRSAPVLSALAGRPQQAQAVRSAAHKHLRVFFLYPPEPNYPDQHELREQAWVRFEQEAQQITAGGAGVPQLADVPMLSAAEPPKSRDLTDLEAATVWRSADPAADREAQQAHERAELVELPLYVWRAQSSDLQFIDHPRAGDVLRALGDAQSQAYRLDDLHAALGHLLVLAEVTDAAAAATQQVQDDGAVLDLDVNAIVGPQEDPSWLTAQWQEQAADTLTRVQATVVAQQSLTRAALDRTRALSRYSPTSSAAASDKLLAALGADETAVVASLEALQTAQSTVTRLREQLSRQRANGLGQGQTPLLQQITAAEEAMREQKIRHRAVEHTASTAARALATIGGAAGAPLAPGGDEYGDQLLDDYARDLSAIRYSVPDGPRASTAPAVRSPLSTEQEARLAQWSTARSQRMNPILTFEEITSIAAGKPRPAHPQQTRLPSARTSGPRPGLAP